ncbi:MAG: MFS transporter [Chlamydiae bacterium]|nr:MFS transporter [Chlamydiota bacterium]
MSKKIIILILLFIFGVLFNFSITTMSAIYIVGDLGGSSFIAPYAMSFFGVGNALTLPLANYMRLRVGFRKAILFTLFSFAFVTSLVGCATFFPSFIFLRFLQGVFAGPPFILAMALMKENATEEQREIFLKWVILSFLTASVLGGSFSGVIAYMRSWQISFFIDAALLWILFGYMAKYLPDFENKEPCTGFDFLGYGYFVFFVAPFALFLILGQQLDWFRSHFITICFFVSLSSLIGLIYRCTSSKNPLINFTLFKNLSFSFAIATAFFLFSSYYGLLNNLSLWLSIDVNYTPAWVSFSLLMMVAAAIVFNEILWKKEYRGSWVILLLGIFLLGWSCFYSQKFNVEINFGRIAFARLLAGFGSAMFLPTLMSIILRSHPDEKRIPVVLCFQLARVLSSTFGVAFYSTMWQRRAVFYHSRLGEQMTIYSPLTKAKFLELKSFDLSDGQALAGLEKALDLQSRSLALADCLYFIGWITVALFLGLIVKHGFLDKVLKKEEISER